MHLCLDTKQAVAGLCLPRDTLQSLESCTPRLHLWQRILGKERSTPTLTPQPVRALEMKANTLNPIQEYTENLGKYRALHLAIRLMMTQCF